MSSLNTTLGDLTLNTPILNASGTFYADSFQALSPLNASMGAIVTKTVTPEPKPGNDGRRTWELAGRGMLNSIGLQNPGIEAFLANDLPAHQAYQLPVMVSLSAPSAEAFGAMAVQLCQSPHAALIGGLELNLSCPNVSAGGAHFGSQPRAVEEVCREVKQALSQKVGCRWPIFAKLTPNSADLIGLADSALAGGATGITAINTVMGMAIDTQKRRPVFERVSAGYSGPAIFPISLWAVWQLRAAFPTIPIIGVGGLTRFDDVLAMLMAGATAVQLGTACFAQPTVFQTVHAQLHAYLEQHQLTLAELVGCAHTQKLEL